MELKRFDIGDYWDGYKQGQQDFASELKKFINDDKIWIEQYSRVGILKKIDTLLKEQKEAKEDGTKN